MGKLINGKRDKGARKSCRRWLTELNLARKKIEEIPRPKSAPAERESID